MRGRRSRVLRRAGTIALKETPMNFLIVISEAGQQKVLFGHDFDAYQTEALLKIFNAVLDEQAAEADGYVDAEDDGQPDGPLTPAQRAAGFNCGTRLHPGMGEPIHPRGLAEER